MLALTMNSCLFGDKMKLPPSMKLLAHLLGWIGSQEKCI